MEKRRSVGIVIVVEINGVRYALLQERGELDPEKLPGKLRQSWPGICQVSVHGSIEPGEDEHSALGRETAEELGPALIWIVGLERKLISDVERSGEQVVTYAVEIPWEAIRKIPRGFSGLHLVSVAEAVKIQSATCIADGKTLGAIDRQIWMFPDERDAVIKALQS